MQTNRRSAAASSRGRRSQASAKKRGIPPQQFCDEVSAEFRALLPRLNISSDDFIRTTEERHKKVVRQVLQQLFDKGEIYQAEYRGFYSTRQEQFLQDKDRNPEKSVVVLKIEGGKAKYEALVKP